MQLPAAVLLSLPHPWVSLSPLGSAWELLLPALSPLCVSPSSCPSLSILHINLEGGERIPELTEQLLLFEEL